MAGFASEDVEILVHATAPSRGPDDSRYRTIAQAYLDFEPIHRRKLDITERESQESYCPEPETPLESIPISANEAASIARRYMDSPRLSFNSVLDNRGSPSLGGVVTSQRDLKLSENSTSSSHRIADSQPDQTQSKNMLSSPTEVLEHFLRARMTSSNQVSTNRMEPMDEAPTVGRNLHVSPENSQSTTSTLLRRSSKRISSKSGIATANTSKQRRHLLQHSANSLKRKRVDVGFETTGAGSSLEPSTQPSQRSPPERPEISPEMDEVRRSSHGQGIEQNDPASQVVPASSQGANAAQSPWSLLIEIRPSPPETGIEPLTPDMLVTTYLRDLGERMPCPYKPTEQKRELRPMERGYWLIDCSSWNEGLRRLCWDGLGRLVGGDRVGWGVWCVRTGGYESIRVYCWGIIVPNIYLLLYVATQRKIKGTSPCWIGGNGEAIVKML